MFKQSGLLTTATLILLAVQPALAIDKELLTAATAEQSATIITLERLVNIESGTGDVAGLAKMVTLLEGELKGLGFTVERSAAVGEREGVKVVGDNVVGRLKGRAGKHVLLLAHMDTVYTRGKLATAPFRIEGDKAYGPGIADDKSGIAVILHSLKLLKARGFSKFGTLTVLFNCDEEQGSNGSRDLIEKLAGESDVVLSFEPTSIKPEGMTFATSGVGSVVATVTGRSAHAGAAPEQGVNAQVEASDLVLRTLDLDQGPGGLRFNWTVANAGGVRNIIPDKAVVQADVRYPTNALYEAMVRDLDTRVKKQRLPEAKIEVVTDAGRPAFAANAGGKALIAKAVSIYKDLGYTLVTAPITGGGTDAAFAAKSGKPVVEGLGLPGFGYHTTFDEYVMIDAIPRRLYLAAQMIMDVAQGK
ncbi:glutamate carboxypeptidase [Gloeobacter morelensis]|uniref:M20/M25/M40 family metallo-hydrolase n=1 Tax=Gloeobacter morelensis MG652769 TaxID=2781736 RepID=A0ABY3PLK5_9CYAN|nr:glutamate carboxypeptidase [Gloeobacter morelensis]UFP94576.1 M20/M25/M40 family metallo-hydrolase [Gloeobacter morelensis MG652769]